MELAISIAVIVSLVGGAIAYIVYSKKSGKRFIGCPDSKACSGKCGGCRCGCEQKNKDK